jgi:CRP-like cAMP-binding protein
MSHSSHLLRSFPLFQGLTADEAAQIARLTVPRLLPRRTAVFREGDEVESIYFVANENCPHCRSLQGVRQG